MMKTSEMKAISLSRRKVCTPELINFMLKHAKSDRSAKSYRLPLLSLTKKTRMSVIAIKPFSHEKSSRRSCNESPAISPIDGGLCDERWTWSAKQFAPTGLANDFSRWNILARREVCAADELTVTYRLTE